jgi:proteic killer suppression protein
MTAKRPSGTTNATQLDRRQTILGALSAFLPRRLSATICAALQASHARVNGSSNLPLTRSKARPSSTTPAWSSFPATAILLSILMIKRIRHKGLKRFYEKRRYKGDQRAACGMASHSPDRPRRRSESGFEQSGLWASLKGERKGQWAVWVSGNWRLVFAFDGEDVTDLDLIDYH